VYRIVVLEGGSPMSYSGWLSTRVFVLAALLVLMSTPLRQGYAAPITYVYDEGGRLVGVVDAGGDTATYKYDAVGNLLSIQRQSSSAVSIISFAPRSGPAGTAVTLYGTGFSATPGQNSVAFNGTAASVTSSTATSIVTTVPIGATTGLISVIAPAGNATTDMVFTVLTAPDLVVTDVEAPSTASSQQDVHVAWRVENQGKTTQAAWADWAFLSASQTCCAGATFLGNAANVRALEDGDAYTRYTTLTVANIPAGNYYLIVRTDYANGIAETAETNNDRSIPIAITTPDIATTALTAPAAVVTQETIAASWTVTNQGTGTTQRTWIDAPFFSTDQVCCSGDTGVGAWGNLQPLPPGASYTQNATINVPTIAAGDYYLLVRADHSNVLYEPNDSNNQRAVPIRINSPDLIVTDVAGPTVVSTQQAINVSWTVLNQGTGTTQKTWIDAPFFSSDGVCCSGDTGLGSWGNVSSLAPAASYTRTATLTVPNVAAGNYNVILRADYFNALYEATETNNDRALALTVGTPDLIVTNITSPASAARGQSISVSWTVQNQGTATTQVSWTDAPFFSSDSLCCSGDTGVGAWGNVTTLAPGATYTRTATVTVPNVAAGNYYFIVRADYWNTLHEANNNNNDLAVPITVTP
jgi:large repetitive protein